MTKHRRTGPRIVTFFHDTEQDFDCDVKAIDCIEAVDKFIALEQKHGIKTTYNVVGKIIETQPELIAKIRNAGHELAFHSYSHDTNWRPEIFYNEVESCRRVDPQVQGYRSPRSQWDQTTIAAEVANQFGWTAESDKASEPYFISDSLVRLPICMDDWYFFTDREDKTAWLDNFEFQFERRNTLAIGFHDCYAALMGNSLFELYDGVIQRAKDYGAIILPFGELATCFAHENGKANLPNHSTAMNNGKAHESALGDFRFRFNTDQILPFYPDRVKNFARKMIPNALLKR